MSRYVFLVLLLLMNVILSFIVGLLLDQNIFYRHDWGFQFLIYGIAANLMFFFISYFRKIYLLPIILCLALLYMYEVLNSSLAMQFNSPLLVFIYCFLLMAALGALIYVFWFRYTAGIIRNLGFSFLFSCVYAGIQFIFHQILDLEMRSDFLIRYFINMFSVTITISLALNLTLLIRTAAGKQLDPGK